MLMPAITLEVPDEAILIEISVAIAFLTWLVRTVHSKSWPGEYGKPSRESF